MNGAFQHIKIRLADVFRSRYPNGLDDRMPHADVLLKEIMKELLKAFQEEKLELGIAYEPDAVFSGELRTPGLIFFDLESGFAAVAPVHHRSRLLWIGKEPRPIFLGQPEGPVVLLNEVVLEIDQFLTSVSTQNAER